MMTKPASPERAAATVARTREIARWLETVGASPTEMAVDFADLLSAARLVDEMLSKLVQLDVRNAQQADEALQLLGSISAQLFTELRGHLDSLEREWDGLEERVDALGAPEED
jgi:hypothetical protein